MPKKKSVAESIEHLLKPKKLAQSDSEDEEVQNFGERTKKLNLDSLGEGTSKPRPSGILKKNVPMLHEIDKKYSGKVASRKDFEEDSDQDDSEDQEDEEDGDDSEEEDEVDSEEDDESSEGGDNDQGISEFISQFKSKVQKDVDSDSDEEAPGASDEDQEEEEDDDSDSNGESAEVEEEEQNYSAEDSEEEEIESESDSETETNDKDKPKSSLKILQPAQDNNVQKGHAVRTQLDLWERMLETRIKVQPMLNKANGFPTAGVFSQLQSSSDEFKELAQTTQKNVAQLLDNLIDLQNTMISQFSETKSLLKSGMYKRKFSEEVTKEGKKSHKKLCLEFQQDGKAEDVFKTYRNSVIQKWSDRTKVTNARNSKEMLLNHNVISQIEGVLLNKPDLIKNSQTVKGTYELFGRKKDEDEEQDGDVKASKWCAEVYDDTDFYHQMLRELIEYKSNSSTNPAEAARNYSELQKLKTKIKKQVDQKASKGRKIRFVVHKKIVSFMAPYSDSNWTEEATQELFTSLFGNYEKLLNKNEKGQEEEERNDDSDMKIL